MDVIAFSGSPTGGRVGFELVSECRTSLCRRQNAVSRLRARVVDEGRQTSTTTTSPTSPQPQPPTPPPPSSPPPPPPSWLPLWACNLAQTAGLLGSPDGAILAETSSFGAQRPGDYLNLLSDYAKTYGGVFKVVLGPKAFLVVADPVAAKSILATDTLSYDKGLLAEVLDEIMGQGLIPARFDVWKKRRREIVPGFHRAWIRRMVATMGGCTRDLISQLDTAVARSPTGDHVVDMEAAFGNVALDIIGKAVFNYDFHSVSARSGIVEAVYQVLQETEHRAMFILPYWKDPLLRAVVPRQRKFSSNMKVISDTLDKMIAEAVQTREQNDAEALENRDYDSLENPSLLRFLVDLRGADVSAKQLRDDMMTMMIAGHETTAAVLTWSVFCLAQDHAILARLQQEVDAVLVDPQRDPDALLTIDEIRQMPLLKHVVAESLRLYPQPPLLIRRAIRDTTLPTNTSDEPLTVRTGVDIFIPTWSLHRSENLWENPDTFDPDRWSRPYSGSAASPRKQDGGESPKWGGRTVASESLMYPNEVSTDYAYVPFGGGARKCVGDQFGFLESAVVLAMFVSKFDFTLAKPADEVGIATGATIHTKEGLPVRLSHRSAPGATADSIATKEFPVASPGR